MEGKNPERPVGSKYVSRVTEQIQFGIVIVRVLPIRLLGYGAGMGYGIFDREIFCCFRGGFVWIKMNAAINLLRLNRGCTVIIDL